MKCYSLSDLIPEVFMCPVFIFLSFSVSTDWGDGQKAEKKDTNCSNWITFLDHILIHWLDGGKSLVFKIHVDRLKTNLEATACQQFKMFLWFIFYYYFVWCICVFFTLCISAKLGFLRLQRAARERKILLRKARVWWMFEEMYLLITSVPPVFLLCTILLSLKRELK